LDSGQGEIADRILHEPGFKPEKEYTLESLTVTPDNAAQMYDKFTMPEMK
jgi:hypothetical protein